MYPRKTNRLLFVLIALVLAAGSALGTTTKPKPKRKAHHVTAATTPAAAKATPAKVIVAHHPVSHLSRLPKKRYVFSPWNVPTFADSTEGDSVDGEDLTVRRAAVQALGPFNGTVVVANPSSGRILTIVNQKLAYQSGFQPCSTIKIVAALAGLSEGILDQGTHFRVGPRRGMGLT
jgi:penicillin-binding protein 2